MPGSGLDTWRNTYSVVRATNTSENHFVMENLQFQKANWQTKGVSQDPEFRDQKKDKKQNCKTACTAISRLEKGLESKAPDFPAGAVIADTEIGMHCSATPEGELPLANAFAVQARKMRQIPLIRASIKHMIRYRIQNYYVQKMGLIKKLFGGNKCLHET